MLARRSTALLLASALLSPAGALAKDRTPPDLAPEPAPAGTAEGARTLREALEVYLSATPFDLGILRVEPDEAGQRIILDPAAALSDLVGRPVAFAPLSLVVSERSDGDWNVFSNDPIDASATFEIDGEERSETYRQDWQAYKGVYSPSLGAFLSLAGESGPTTQAGADAVSRGVAGFMGSVFDLSAEPADGGGADLAFRHTYETYAQTLAVEIPLDEGASDEAIAFSFDASLDSMVNDGSAAGVRTRALLDLQALGLSHAQALADDARGALAGSAGDELKAALAAALPLWDELEVTAEANAFDVSTLFGDLSFERLMQSIRMSGIAEDAFFETQVSLSGIDAQSPMMPEWSSALVPTLIDFGLSVSEVDLATPLAIALREADFERERVLSPEAVEEVLAAFDPERIRGEITGGRIEAELFDLSFEGNVAVAEDGPHARLNLSMGGLDETIAALQTAAAEMPDLNQGIGMLQLAKGFSRPGEDGRAAWDIEARADGSVHLNGTMLKGPEAPGGDDTPSDDL